MKKVLFVCHGNICRSPMAEFILKYLDKNHDYYVESRAVSSEELGHDIYYPAKKILEKYNIPYSTHRSTKISQKDYDDFDDIFIMDELNLHYINRLLDDPKHKIRKLCKQDIEDPWYTDNYEKVFHQIKDGIIAYMNESKHD